jgi:DNA-binding NtrC family response regulator
VKRIGVIGKDPALKAAYSLARRVAPSRSHVVIVGPTGSGKSHMARFLHQFGPSPSSPLIEWHAGAVPESLLEAELLGVSRGTATGVTARPGAFESAGKGTLCMAGIELLRPSQQAILLRVLESRMADRIGGGPPVKIHARIVATFLEPPEALVRRGLLRNDLLYRLDVIRLELPPLGQRRSDIPLHAAAFLKEACRRLGRPVPRLAPALLDALSAYPWPGDLRELAQRMEGLALVGGDPLLVEDLPPSFWMAREPVEKALGQRMTIEELKDAYIRQVLAKVGGNKSKAAQWLGISRKALWAHLRRSES